MKKLKVSMLGSLLCVLFSSLNAVQVAPEVIELIKASSARVADVNAPSQEQVARDLLDSKNEENRSNISKREQPVKTFAGVEESEDEEVINNSCDFVAFYNTSHRAAYHKPVSVSTDGKEVEMEDNSRWEVHSWDASTVRNWQPHQTIIIAPNTNIFTKWSYPFKLVNLDKREIVKANMKFTPVFNDPNIDIYVHWIDDIDYNKRMLRLEDGSLWSISWGDSDVMSRFDRYNIVIVGTNDGWFRSSYPNILICVKNNMFIRGVTIN